jgi:hypothetical protein
VCYAHSPVGTVLDGGWAFMVCTDCGCPH